MTVIDQATVRTRKPHRCWGCGRLYGPGTDMRTTVTADGGRLTRAYWCPICMTVMATWTPADLDSIPYGGVRDADSDVWQAAALEAAR